MTTPYLTEERLRVLGFGSDLEDMESAQIRNLIMAASAKVDVWCNVPRVPQPYSFRGGTITNEQHDWDPGDGLSAAQRLIKLYHKPIKEIAQLRIFVTNTNYTDFATNELFLNSMAGTVEIVSFALTSSTPFGAYVLPNIGLFKPQLRASYTYGWEFTATDEILEATDAKYFRATNQFWDDSDVEVKVDGTVVDPGDYTIDRTEGAIEFDTVQPADAVVTASYGYSLPQEIGQATGLIVHDLLNEKQLLDKGMGGVRSLRVGEIAIDRGLRWDSSSPGASSLKLPPDAEGLLAGYRFITVR